MLLSVSGLALLDRQSHKHAHILVIGSSLAPTSPPCRCHLHGALARVPSTVIVGTSWPRRCCGHAENGRHTTRH